jgi:hypothetical protein
VDRNYSAEGILQRPYNDSHDYVIFARTAQDVEEGNATAVVAGDFGGTQPLKPLKARKNR